MRARATAITRQRVKPRQLRIYLKKILKASPPSLYPEMDGKEATPSLSDSASDAREVAGFFRVALEGEFDEAFEDFGKRHARGVPHLGEAGNVGQAGNRVQFVEQQLAVVAAQEEVNAREARSVDSLEGAHGVAANFLREPFRYRRGDD